MDFNLIDNWLDLCILEQFLDVGNFEIGHSYGSSFAGYVCFLERAPGRTYVLSKFFLDDVLYKAVSGNFWMVDSKSVLFRQDPA